MAKGEAKSPLLSRLDAVKLLGTMLGGYNISPMIDLLDDTNRRLVFAQLRHHFADAQFGGNSG